jgi:hypothetical protein
LEGGWRACRNGGWEWEFGGVWKMEVHIEALLELIFCPKPPSFGVEARIEAPLELLLIKLVVLRLSTIFINRRERYPD